MTEEIGRLLRGKLGRVLKVDTNQNGKSIGGHCLRVWVVLDIYSEKYEAGLLVASFKWRSSLDHFQV